MLCYCFARVSSAWFGGVGEEGGCLYSPSCLLPTSPRADILGPPAAEVMVLAPCPALCVLPAYHPNHTGRTRHTARRSWRSAGGVYSLAHHTLHTLLPSVGLDPRNAFPHSPCVNRSPPLLTGEANRGNAAATCLCVVQRKLLLVSAVSGRR